MIEKSRRVQYLLAFSVGMTTICSGVLVTWPSPVLPKLANNETNVVISDNEMSFLVAMASPGFVTGSFATRFLADKIGRRYTILGGAVVSTLGMIIIIFTVQPWLLYIARFVWGIFNGISVGVCGFYIAEIADKEVRGSLTVIPRVFFNFGGLIIMVIGPYLTYSLLNQILLVLPVLHVACCWWIPESPGFSLKEGKVDEARKNLRMLRCAKDEKALEEELSAMRSVVANEMRRKATYREFITGKAYRKAIGVCIGIKLIYILSGTPVTVLYLGRIMQESNTGISLSAALIVFGVVRFAVGVLQSMFVDRVGRRPLLFWSSVGCGLSLALTGAYFFCKEVIQVDPDTLQTVGFLPFVGMIAALITATFGFGTLIFLIPNEIFPINVRAVALSCVSIFGGILHFGVAVSYQRLKNLFGLCGVFWFFASVTLLGAVFVHFVVPETKGKSLDEIQMIFQGKYYERGDELEKLKSNIDEIDKNKEVEMRLIGNNGKETA